MEKVAKLSMALLVTFTMFACNSNFEPTVIQTSVSTPIPTTTATVTATPTLTPTPTATQAVTSGADLPCTGPFCAPNPLGKIAFYSSRDGNQNEIYIMNSDGSSQTRITNNNFTEYSPTWSPDGTKIAFNTTRNSPEIHSISVDGQNEKSLTTSAEGSASYPSWSQDGTKIVFILRKDNRFNDIYTMNADGSNKVNLTNTTTFLGYIYPKLSPDGTKIAFSLLRNGQSDIYVMNADGSNAANPINLTGMIPNVQNYHPNWSPDGTKIAYNANFSDNVEVMIMDSSNGSGKTNLTNSTGYDGKPSFSPDGREIVFHSDRTGVPQIYKMKSDGSSGTTPTRLTDSTSDQEPTWSRQ